MRRALVLPLAALLAASCSGKDPYNPGTPLGVFHVKGKLASNACAAPDQVPDPWEFEVKLSRDAATLYWIQGGLPVQGHLDANAHAQMTASDSREIRAADPKHNVSGCTLRRDDHLDATLGGEPVTAFKGTLSYTFSPTEESDCSDQITGAGGGFATLPCKVSYELTAVKTGKTTVSY